MSGRTGSTGHMDRELSNRAILSALFWNNIKYAIAGRWLVPGRHLPREDHAVPEDFFGICIATAEDPAVDDYLVDRLNDLGIRCARLDLTYSGEGAAPERLLERLLENGFLVCLHLVQPFEEAGAMKTAESRERWRGFVARVLDRHGARIEILEIGSTVNRRNWTGYTPETFMAAWRIARAEAVRRGIPVAGPNITDFEPLYNIGVLGLMRRFGVLPDIHTNNLFAERATEPETFDHKILGYTLAPVIKFNLVKKARMLAQIGRDFGVPRTISPHVTWSLKRIGRYLVDREEKQADYTARYCCLTAAAGSLERVYWGPMVSRREGLIDDGDDYYPKIPLVTLYDTIPGGTASYRVRPAFDALGAANRFIAGAAFRRAAATTRGLEVHEFRRKDGMLHVVWTTNGNCAAAADIYGPEALSGASAFDRSGAPLSGPPELFTESPTYLLWPPASAPVTLKGASIIPHIRIYNRPGVVHRTVREGIWSGICALPAENGGPISELLPEALEKGAGKEIMRNRRNCVWSMDHPHDPGRQIVVKRLQTRRLGKKLVQSLRPARAVRSWSAANELLRRGIPTPRPVAFFRQHGRSGIADSYFVYDMFDAAGSSRQAFAACAEGDGTFNGITAERLFSKVAECLHTMHNRGVHFRDLAAGNLLIGKGAGGEPELCLIDTARAHFFKRSISMRKRLGDLSRFAFRLDGNARRRLLSAYMERMGRRPAWWMKIPFICYDLKLTIKRKLPRKRLTPRKTRP